MIVNNFDKNKVTRGKNMLDWSKGQMLLYGGIVLIIVAVIAAIVCIVIFKITRKRIHKKLEHDYGKL